NEKALFQMVDLHLATSRRWSELTKSKPAERAPEARETAGPSRWDARLKPSEFTRFKEHLAGKANLSPEGRIALARTAAPDLYLQTASLRIPDRVVAETMAQFLSLSFRDQVPTKALKLAVLPTPFCKSKSVVPLMEEGTAPGFLLSNPFHWEVQEAIKAVVDRNQA